MRIGSLRHRVTLQAESQAQDDAGQLTGDFVDIAEVWASIEPMSVRDVINASLSAANVNTRIVIRWHPQWHQVRRVLHVPNPRIPQQVNLYEVTAGLTDPDSGRHYVTFPATLRVMDGWRRGTD